jgi:hypothetical protein
LHLVTKDIVFVGFADPDEGPIFKPNE